MSTHVEPVFHRASRLTPPVLMTTRRFDRAERFLKLMGGKITHCGQSGNGLAVKIANNLLLGITMAGTAYAQRYTC